MNPNYHDDAPDFYEVSPPELLEVDGPDGRGQSSAVDDEDSLTTYLKVLGQYKLLTAADEVELAQKIEAGDTQAFHTMVNANLRLVVRAARRYLGSGMPFADLIQEGNLGLMHAVKKYDWRLGWRFSTYAVWWIKQAIDRAIMNQFGTIRLPIHISKQVRKLTYTVKQLADRMVDDPTIKDIAEAMGESEEKVHSLMCAIVMNQVDRLEDQVSTRDHRARDESAFTLQEIIADENLPDPYELMSADVLPYLEKSWLAQLPAAERQVIEYRFGVHDEPKTLEQVASLMKLTRERIRQLQASGLTRLRGICNMEGFDEMWCLQ